jgi:hypothetical protein
MDDKQLFKTVAGHRAQASARTGPMKHHPVTLVCWTCGRKKAIETDGPPQLAVQLVSWAIDVGWLGTIDMDHNRGLVFCSEDCRDAAKTKTGSFRIYPPKVVLTCSCGERVRTTGPGGPRGGDPCRNCEGRLSYCPDVPTTRRAP